MEWMPEFTKLLRTKSTMRYLPPKGTAGLARSRVRGKSRVPLPPASTMPSTRRCKAPCGADANSRSELTFPGNQGLLNSSLPDVTKGGDVLNVQPFRRCPTLPRFAGKRSRNLPQCSSVTSGRGYFGTWKPSCRVRCDLPPQVFRQSSRNWLRKARPFQNQACFVLLRNTRRVGYLYALGAVRQKNQVFFRSISET